MQTVVLFFVLMLMCPSIVDAQLSRHRRHADTGTHSVNRHADTSIILWHKQVMRELNLAISTNKPLLSLADSNNKVSTLGDVLYKMVVSGKAGTWLWDTAQPHALQHDPVVIPADELIHLKSSTTKYAIREVWKFDREQGQMLVDILWIAPEDPATGRPLFWIKYADVEGEFCRYSLMAKDEPRPVNLQHFFAARMFSSRITWVENVNFATGKNGSTMESWMY